MAQPLDAIAAPIEQVLAGKPAAFSWQVLLADARRRPRRSLRTSL